MQKVNFFLFGANQQQLFKDLFYQIKEKEEQQISYESNQSVSDKNLSTIQ